MAEAEDRVVEERPRATARAVKADPPRKARPEVIVTAAEVYAEYKDNGIRADQRFLNKRVRIIGRMVEIKSDPLHQGEYLLRLATGDRFNIHTVTVRFDVLPKNSENLRPGEWVVTDGTGVERVLDPEFDEGHAVGRANTEEDARRIAETKD